MPDRKKQQERYFVEAAARLLGLRWTLNPDSREKPDFIVTDASSRFGLEVTLVHIDVLAKHRKGSRAKAQESNMAAAIRRCQVAYEKRFPTPITVRLVGHIGPDDQDAALRQLDDLIRAIDPEKWPLGAQRVVEVNADTAGPLKAYVTKGSNIPWMYVNHTVGFVEQSAAGYLAECIQNKSSHLRCYRSSSGLNDIRLLIVADRTWRSGKLDLPERSPFDLNGFSAVYFLSYPETALELPNINETNWIGPRRDVR